MEAEKRGYVQFWTSDINLGKRVAKTLYHVGYEQESIIW
jgi:hypothetical protein